MVLAMPAWLDPGVDEWIDQCFEQYGIRQAGPVEVIKSRAWSLVSRIPTVDGPVWFKANGGDTRYEAGLAQALARWVPDRVPTPIAIDAARGWQLTPDGGTVMRDTAAAADLSSWEDMVAAYARLQLDLAPYVEEMVALGVPDHRPEKLLALTTALVEDPARAFDEARRDELRGMLAEYENWCARLADSGIPASLNHDDLHDANVLVRPAQPLTFFDWGDAGVAFPFTTLLVTLGVVAHRFALTPGDPGLLRVRDAYLDAYGVDLDHARALAEFATWTGKSGRALSWQRALSQATAAEIADFEDPVSGWIEELLTPGPLRTDWPDQPLRLATAP